MLTRNEICSVLHCSVHFAWTAPLIFITTLEAGSVIILDLQVLNHPHRDLKPLAQGHTASLWGSWDSTHAAWLPARPFTISLWRPQMLTPLRVSISFESRLCARHCAPAYWLVAHVPSQESKQSVLLSWLYKGKCVS